MRHPLISGRFVVDLTNALEENLTFLGIGCPAMFCFSVLTRAPDESMSPKRTTRVCVGAPRDGVEAVHFHKKQIPS
jgi:hypothetical protein